MSTNKPPRRASRSPPRKLKQRQMPQNTDQSTVVSALTKTQPIERKSDNLAPTIVGSTRTIVPSTRTIVRDPKKLVRDSPPIVRSAQTIVRNPRKVVRNSPPIVRDSRKVVRTPPTIVRPIRTTVSNSRKVVREAQQIFGGARKIARHSQMILPDSQKVGGNTPRSPPRGQIVVPLPRRIQPSTKEGFGPIERSDCAPAISMRYYGTNHSREECSPRSVQSRRLPTRSHSLKWNIVVVRLFGSKSLRWLLCLWRRHDWLPDWRRRWRLLFRCRARGDALAISS